MRVLVACEFSGRVREAFRAKGHDVISCDLLPADDRSPHHYQGDVFDLLKTTRPFHMLIAFPPCTHLAASGARWFKEKRADGRQQNAVSFVEALWDCGIPKIAIENPVGVLPRLSNLGPATQYIQPWQFGHGETKKTGLWLKGLPKLKPTNIVKGRNAFVHRLPPSHDRWKKRSETKQGIAEAMAEQWG